MDSLDDWLIAIHVLAAVVWVGGSLTMNLLATRIQRTSSPERLGAFLQDTEFVGQRTYLPASLILLATGITLVARDIFTFQTWVAIGLGVWAYSFVMGAAVIAPLSGKIGKAVAAEGPEAPAVQAGTRKLLILARIELALLILVVLDMSLKPGA